MHEPDLLRRLAEAFDDIEMHFRLLALMPWTVHVDHRAERVEYERRRSRERAEALLARIPTQRSREITLPRRGALR